MVQGISHLNGLSPPSWGAGRFAPAPTTHLLEQRGPRRPTPQQEFPCATTSRGHPFLFRPFFFCQYSLSALVSLANQARSSINSTKSLVAKYLTLLGRGLPNGFKRRAD